jgi:hypothetical protein
MLPNPIARSTKIPGLVIITIVQIEIRVRGIRSAVEVDACAVKQVGFAK